MELPAGRALVWQVFAQPAFARIREPADRACASAGALRVRATFPVLLPVQARVRVAVSYQAPAGTAFPVPGQGMAPVRAVASVPVQVLVPPAAGGPVQAQPRAEAVVSGQFRSRARAPVQALTPPPVPGFVPAVRLVFAGELRSPPVIRPPRTQPGRARSLPAIAGE